MSQLSLSRARQASLRLNGPDHKGLVAACSQLLDLHGCGITNSEQWTDRLANLYFQRVLFDTASLRNCYGHDRADMDGRIRLNEEKKMNIEFDLEAMRKRFGLTTAEINWRERPKKVAVMVSKYDHCLVSFQEIHKANFL